MEKHRKVARLNRRRKRRTYWQRAEAKRRAVRRQRHFERLNVIAPYSRHPTRTKERARRIPAPESINLSGNFEETVRFLNDVRMCATTGFGRFFVDFTTIKHITAAGALLVVAEFDRWRELMQLKRLEPLKADQWDPLVKNRLIEMGFFQLLQSSRRIDMAGDSPASDGERYLPFISGHQSEGEKAKQLRIEIEKLGPKLRDRQSLFEGLTEAMTNVEHHAYAPGARIKRWWMSASVDATGRRLRVMFVDHGQGIPNTLPPDLVEAARAAVGVGPFEAFVKSDAKLIKAAVSLNRSQTKKLNRGWGLKRDIQGYIERHEAVGSLRIVSGRGQYRYTKQSGEKGRVLTKALPVPFNGTFIEWIIEEYAVGDEHE